MIYIARHGQGYRSFLFCRPLRSPFFAHLTRALSLDENTDNAAETAYGKALWDCWYSLLTGDGNSSWADAELTPLGIEQAQENNAAWKTQIEEGVPLPQKLYSSPMRRAAKTLDITWCVSFSSLSSTQAQALTFCCVSGWHRSDILLNQDGYRPLIREGLRESIGLHTCDERSNKTVIEGLFPGFDFEPSFTHNDELVRPFPSPSSLRTSLLVWTTG